MHRNIRNLTVKIWKKKIWHSNLRQYTICSFALHIAKPMFNSADLIFESTYYVRLDRSSQVGHHAKSHLLTLVVGALEDISVSINHLRSSYSQILENNSRSESDPQQRAYDTNDDFDMYYIYSSYVPCSLPRSQ
jgi:hypothetical protein